MQIIAESEREKVATFGVEMTFAAQGKWHRIICHKGKKNVKKESFWEVKLQFQFKVIKL